jgi:hypothetical protein
MERSEHQFLTNEADALKHRDWLLNMVGRFKAEKETLAKVRAGYEDEVSWVLPSKDSSKH